MADRAQHLKALEKMSNTGDLFKDGLTPDMIDMDVFRDVFRANSDGGGKKPKRTRRKRRSLK